MILQKPLVNAPPRLQRMLLKLQGYNFKLEYQPGKELVVADTLSRLPNSTKHETIDLDVRVDHIQFQTDRLNSIRESTQNDPIFKVVRNNFFFFFMNGNTERAQCALSRVCIP